MSHLRCYFCHQEKDKLPCSLRYCLTCKNAALTLDELRSACSCEEEMIPLPGSCCKECAKEKFDQVEMGCPCCTGKTVERSKVYLCVKCKIYTCYTPSSVVMCFQCREMLGRCKCRNPPMMSLCSKCMEEEMPDLILMYHDVNYSVKGGS